MQKHAHKENLNNNLETNFAELHILLTLHDK
jgi:hypothetical protein